MHNVSLSPATPGTVPLRDDFDPATDSPAADTIGTRLVRLRRTAGLTQADVAARLGVTMASVCYWEQDRSRPKPARLKALAALLGCEMSALLEPGAPVTPSTSDLPSLIANARAAIASAAGTRPDRVKIIIEV